MLVLNSFPSLRRLPFKRIFSAYFDATERRLVTRSIVIGALVWIIVLALKNAVQWTFHNVVEWVDAGPSPWMILLPMGIGALIMTFFSRFRTSTVDYRDNEGHIRQLRDVEGDGLERAIALYYASEPSLEHTLLGQEGADVRWQLPTFSLVIRKFLATLTTLGSGGSGGLTASASLIGESVAAGLFKPRQRAAHLTHQLRISRRLWHWWRSSGPDELQTAQLSGIAAAVATLLGAPFASAFFAIEVMYRRRPVVEKLLYALLSALVAFFLSSLFVGRVTLFSVERVIRPPATLGYYGALVLLAVLIAQIGVYFSWMRAQTSRFFRSGNFTDLQRNVTGFMLTGVIGAGVAVITGQRVDLVMGIGETTINAALAGELTLQIAMIAFAGKMLATLATVGSGGSAGLLVPSIFLGTMIASILASLFGFAPIQLIIPAVTASLVSIVNVPIAATLLVIELFDSSYLIPSLVVLVLTLIFTHRSSIYRTQREVDEKREILPGYSVRRVVVPPAWMGKSVTDLQIRSRYGLNVIGLIEMGVNGESGDHGLALNPAVDRPLRQGDILLLLGQDEVLDQLAANLFAEFDAVERGDRPVDGL
jgi:chloride channel protein, CIC family